MILVESSKATTRSDVRFYVSSSILKKKTLLPSVQVLTSTFKNVEKTCCVFVSLYVDFVYTTPILYYLCYSGTVISEQNYPEVPKGYTVRTV